MACPSAQQLASLAEGSRDAAGIDHLTTCIACTEVVRMVRGADSDHALATRADEPSAPAPGDTIGRYVVLRVVAQGGMGEVYLGYDPILDRNVALKLVRTDRTRSPGFTARLAREGQVLAKLAHANVVRVFDAGTWRGVVYVAMEYLDGESLRTWCAMAPRTEAEIVRVVIGAARGIGAAHALGIVHRDIKPDNILVGSDGAGRIADFGLVSEVADPDTGEETGCDVLPRPLLTEGKGAVGTAGYRAPELVAGGIADPRSDQWSLCATLAELLLGELPSSVAAISARPARKLSRTTSRVLRRGLDADPHRRFPSLDDLADHLDHRPRLIRNLVVAALISAAIVTVIWIAGGRDRDPLAHCAGEARAAVVDAEPLHADGFRHRFDVLGASAASLRAASERELESYTSRLATSAVGACRAEPIDRAAAALQRACVADRRRELRAMVTELRASDRSGLEQAPLAIAKLPDPGLCDHPSELATLVPVGPMAQAEADRIADEVATLRSRWLLGQRAALLAMARSVAERAERLGAATVAASTTGLLADFLGESGDLTASRDAHMTAARHAARAHDDRALALHLIKAAGIAAIDLALERASTLLASAEIIAVRVNDRSVQDLLDGSKAELAIQRGDVARAVPACRALVARLRDRDGRRGADYFRALHQLARALFGAHELVEARQVTNTAISDITAELGADHPETIAFYTQLGKLAIEAKALDEARQHLERATQIARAAYGEDNLLTGETITNLAAIFALQDRDEQAIELGKQGIAIGERLGSRRLHMALSSLATVYLDRGNVKEGLPLMQRSLALREELYGADSPELLRPLIVLGMASSDAKDLDGARRYWTRAVAILNVTPNPPDFGVDLMRDLASIVEDPRAARVLRADADALERRLAARAKLARAR